MLLLLGGRAMAQDSEIVGYANVWYTLKAAPEDGGQVCVTTTATGLKTWKSTVDYNQTVQVANMLYSNVIMFYIFARPKEGYAFSGWYQDADGDGVLDISKDVLLSNSEEFVVMAALDDDVTVYSTQAEAKNGTKPAESEPIVFAYFTRGAIVGLSYYQGEDYANCGSVFCDKPTNEPGDIVTVRALPTDGFQFEYWQTASSMGDIISRENPYTFTVQGGERLFAYFTAIDAPQVELPEEGGFAVLFLDAPWVMTDETMKAGTHILVMESEDLTRADGKIFLDMSKEESHIDIGQQSGAPTIIYGKGTVRFAYKMSYGFARKAASEFLVRWSGSKGTTVRGDNLYIYAFREDLGAFVTIGNTDQMLNPDAPTSFSVPANLAYFSISAFEVVDDNGNIPPVIGLSPETYDLAMTGIDDLHPSPVSIQPSSLIMYDLQGRAMQNGKVSKGIYILNGRKYIR